jgi:uncharacterized protein YcfJ
MEQSLTLGRLVRRLLGCAAIGACVLIFAKPLILLALALTVLASIGFLIWLPVHLVVGNRLDSWQSVCVHGRRWLQPAGQTCRSAAETVQTFLDRATPVVSGFLLEAVSGAVVAVVLGLAAGGQGSVVAGAALSGALAGGLLALTRGWQAYQSRDAETEMQRHQGANRSSSQTPFSLSR